MLDSKTQKDHLKYCKGCDTVKSADEFYKDKKCKSGLYYICKICKSVARKEANQKYYQNNKEKYDGSKTKRNKSQNREKQRRRKQGYHPRHRKEIMVFYDEAVRLTETTGVRYEVDHIIPLNNKFVCGLHVPCNLQIQTASDNGKKSNVFIKWWEE